MTETYGILKKSHPKSFFVAMGVSSDLAETYILTNQPKYRDEKVVVLQIMVYPHDRKNMIVEMVREKDFDGLFEMSK